MQPRYTEYLRNIMNTEQGRNELEKALSTYPLYASKNPALVDLIPTREKLNEKILNHYKYREIGFETPGRFFDELKITMCEIMPKYNELFKSVETMSEIPSPFDNVDVTETFEQETSQNAKSEGSTLQNVTGVQTGTNTLTMNTETENSGTSNGKITNTVNSKDLESDTPQGELNIGTKDIDGVSYASKASWNEGISDSSEERSTSDSSSVDSTSTGSNSSETETASHGTTTGTSESSGIVKHTFTKKGNQGVNTYAHDMNEFRTAIIDVVDMIISDHRLNELFMLVY